MNRIKRIIRYLIEKRNYIYVLIGIALMGLAFWADFVLGLTFLVTVLPAVVAVLLIAYTDEIKDWIYRD